MGDSIIPTQPAKVNAPGEMKLAKNEKEPNNPGTASSAPDVKALQGSTTIDDKVSIEAEILAFQAVGKIAKQIRSEFDAKFPNLKDEEKYCIILLDDTISPALAAQQALCLSLDLISQDFKSVISGAGATPKLNVQPSETFESRTELPKTNLEFAMAPAAVSSGFAAASSVGRAAIDFLSLLRQDTSYFGRSYTVKDTAVALEFLRGLVARPDVECFYPKLMLYRAAETTQRSLERLEGRLRAVQNLRDRAKQSLQDLSRDTLELQLEISPPKPQHHPSGQELMELSTQLIEKRIRLDASQKLYDAAADKLDKTLAGLNIAEANGITVGETIEKAEEILSRFQIHKLRTIFLYVEAVALAGGYRVRSNLWRTLFNSDGLSYSGGAIVTYAFINSKAELVLCGTHRWRTPFLRLNERDTGELDTNSF
jgi:hypothetical protein